MEMDSAFPFRDRVQKAYNKARRETAEAEEASRQRRLEHRGVRLCEWLEPLGVAVGPEDLTVVRANSATPDVEYEIEGLTFGLNEHWWLVLRLRCPRCGAPVDLGVVNSVVALGAILADGPTVDRYHTCSGQAPLRVAPTPVRVITDEEARLVDALMAFIQTGGGQ